MSLQTQSNSLVELYNRVQSLRQVPHGLLKPPVSHGLPLPTQSFHAQFQQLKDTSDILRSDAVQAALRAAQDSEKADSSGINSNGRRENRKRRRPPSPESPQPYIAPERSNSSLFPPADDDLSALKATDLVEYIRKFNRSHKARLHIWRSTRGSEALDIPTIVRLTIQDVMTTYIVLGYTPDNPVLIIESVTAFAPRERKSPHSQSGYLIYQNLSQHLAGTLQSHPSVSLQSLIDLLLSYENLFVEGCSSCGRVLSLEGHVPPVVRIWTEGQEGERGRWDPRHVTCRHT